MDKAFGRIQEFMRLETSGGIVLMIAAVFAMIIANTPLATAYDAILGTYIKVGIGSFEIAKPAILWINDGLMAIFFFLVGLEIKREVLVGELSSFDKAILPIMAAIGGMAVPGLIFAIINWGTPENLNGWAIPTATDIAFALGILALIGSRAPVALKIFLLAIAIIDDLGAIVIIAVFYTSNLDLEPLYFAAAALVGLFLLNARCEVRTAPYVILGIILWMAVLKSGVHATLAGVATAFFIPVQCKKNPDITPCKNLEHALHPWVSFIILPIFAFANAGVPFKGMGLHSFGDPTTLGIILGLVLGKQVGIFATLWLTIKTGLSPKPTGTTWLHLYGVAALCGIGFTMSLFIGGLAFADLEHQASIRLGVLTGSIISAIVGYCILYFAPSPDRPEQPKEAVEAS